MTHDGIRRWAWAVIAAGAAVGGVGCGQGADAAGEPESRVQILSARDLDALGPDEVFAIDLTDPAAQVEFDHTSGPIDFARISLTCPDGTGMPMHMWLALEAQRDGVPASVMGERLRLLAAQIAEAAEEAAPDDQVDCVRCHWCADGAFICEDFCSSASGAPRGEPWHQGDPWRWLCPPGVSGCEDRQSAGDFIEHSDSEPDWSAWADAVPESDSGGWGGETPGGGGSGDDGDRQDGAAGDVGFGSGGGGGGDDGGDGGDGADDGSSGADEGGGGGGGGGGGVGGGGGGGGGGGYASGGGGSW
jgi:hypothetical protein